MTTKLRATASRMHFRCGEHPQSTRNASCTAGFESRTTSDQSIFVLMPFPMARPGLEPGHHDFQAPTMGGAKALVCGRFVEQGYGPAAHGFLRFPVGSGHERCIGGLNLGELRERSSTDARVLCWRMLRRVPAGPRAGGRDNALDTRRRCVLVNASTALDTSSRHQQPQDSRGTKVV
jgi:hypothetical protein